MKFNLAASSTTLRRDLLGILIAGVLVAFGLLLAIRVFNELPALYVLEGEADRGAVKQVRDSLAQRVRSLERPRQPCRKPPTRSWKRYSGSARSV